MRPSVPILRLPDAHGLDTPKYADGVGTTLSLQAAISVPLKLDVGESALVPTGFAFTLPLGREAQVRSHRELSETTGLIVLNAPATIDSSYQEEVKVLLYNKGENAFIVRRGQEIASLVFSPVLRVRWDEVNPPQEKEPEKPDTTPILAQSEDETLTPAVVKEALKQAEKATQPEKTSAQAGEGAPAQIPVQPAVQTVPQAHVVKQEQQAVPTAGVAPQTASQTQTVAQGATQSATQTQTAVQRATQGTSQIQAQTVHPAGQTAPSVPPVKPPHVPVEG